MLPKPLSDTLNKPGRLEFHRKLLDLCFVHIQESFDISDHSPLEIRTFNLMLEWLRARTDIWLRMTCEIHEDKYGSVVIPESDLTREVPTVNLTLTVLTHATGKWDKDQTRGHLEILSVDQDFISSLVHIRGDDRATSDLAFYQ